MKYGIIANPVSGKRSKDEKNRLLNEIAGILKDATISGLDTTSPEEFSCAAHELSQKVDTLLVAGGDGTFSLVLNSVAREVPLGFLPFGSGDVLRHTFHLPHDPKEAARQIQKGKEHVIDIISCDGKTRALFASIGIEGCILLERDRHLANELRGFLAYGLATVQVLFDGYVKADLRVAMENGEVTTCNSLTAVITKLPYYGYGFKVVPQAKFDDGYLHMLILNAGPIATLYALATALVAGGNRMGEYYKAKEINITTSTEQLLQRNGDPEKEKRKKFSFKVLPKDLKLVF